jgi:hypothetical protein
MLSLVSGGQTRKLVDSCMGLYHELHDVSSDFSNVNAEVEGSSQSILEPDTFRTRRNNYQQNKTLNLDIRLLENCRNVNVKLAPCIIR